MTPRKLGVEGVQGAGLRFGAPVSVSPVGMTTQCARLRGSPRLDGQPIPTSSGRDHARAGAGRARQDDEPTGREAGEQRGNKEEARKHEETGHNRTGEYVEPAWVDRWPQYGSVVVEQEQEDQSARQEDVGQGLDACR